MREPKIHVTAKEFIRAMQGKRIVDLNGNEHSEHIVWSMENNNEVGWVEIKNLLVTEPINIRGLIFKHDVNIESCGFTYFALESCRFESSLFFNEIEFDESLTIARIAASSFSLIRSKVKIGLINLIYIKVADINLQELEVLKGGLHIGSSQSKSAVRIDGLNVATSLSVVDLSCDKLFLSGTEVNEEMSIDGVIAKNDVRFSKLNVRGDLRVSECDFGGNVNIIESNFGGKFQIYDTKIAKEQIIINSRFDFLGLSSMPEKSVLKIYDSFFKEIHTSTGFINLGYLYWNDLKPLPGARVIIQNAFMGKWDIVKCNFASTDLIIYSSKLTDTFYTNTIFPKTLKLPPWLDDVQIKEREHFILRDGYNQLKAIAQKQNDRGMFLHFQTEELHSYMMTLTAWKDWRTIFQLVAMRVSNEYGANWWRGVWFVLLVNALCMGICYWNYWPTFGKESFWAYVGKFSEFLFSIGKKPDFVHSGFQTFIYYLSRIPLAFGIYQTIAAFRKFGKSE